MAKPKITIEYCPKCGWLLRAAWIAQEILTTFTEEIGEVALRPSQIAGNYQIYLNDELFFDRKTAQGFPQPKELKQKIRDKIAPEKSLGHSDKK
jgi:selenoprotein W-related protein